VVSILAFSCGKIVNNHPFALNRDNPWQSFISKELSINGLAGFVTLPELPKINRQKSIDLSPRMSLNTKDKNSR
jgi:hypothetical protein